MFFSLILLIVYNCGMVFMQILIVLVIKMNIFMYFVYFTYLQTDTLGNKFMSDYCSLLNVPYAAPCASHFKIRPVVSSGKRIGLFFATPCESHFKIRSVASSEKRFCHSFTTQCESHLKKRLVASSGTLLILTLYFDLRLEW